MKNFKLFSALVGGLALIFISIMLFVGNFHGEKEGLVENEFQKFIEHVFDETNEKIEEVYP